MRKRPRRDTPHRGDAVPSLGVTPAGRPRLRGVSHACALPVAAVCGLALTLTAANARARVAAAVYAGAVCALFAVSALYHRVSWRPRARRWMRRLDHTMIFVLIAGTCTPIALIALSGTLSTVLLWVAWGGAGAGALLELAFIDAPKWLFASVYLALGWSGWLAVGGLAAGGLLYSAGAVIYAREAPNPLPGVFGYHEVFHALVIAAAALHYAVIAFAVMPHA